MEDQEQLGPSHLPVEEGQQLLQGWTSHSLALPVPVRQVTGIDTSHLSVVLGISEAFKVIAEEKPNQISPWIRSRSVPARMALCQCAKREKVSLWASTGCCI